MTHAVNLEASRGGLSTVAGGSRKVIITAVVNGAPHASSMSGRPPATPDEVVEQALESTRAGAAILHFYGRGLAESGPDGPIATLVPRIAAETDAIISIGAVGDPSTRPEARIGPLLKARPELCTLGLPTIARPFPAERAVEEALVAVAGDEDMQTAPGDDGLGTLRTLLTRFAGARTRFAFECHDAGHLHLLKRLVDEGLVEGPLLLHYGLGAWQGTGAAPESLSLLRAAADHLFGREGHEFSVFATGRQQMSVITLGAIMGGHVRVGPEDGPHVSRGPSAMSCSAQVLKVRRILDELSLPIATPAEAREILHTRDAAGGDVDG